MLMPSIFGETLLDDFFGFPTVEDRRSRNNVNGLMQTDIKEDDKGYHVMMNLPGFSKEDVKGELKDGYLTITATTNSSKEDSDSNGKYIRRERYSGSCSRSFYVGEDITQEDIEAKFENGILSFMVPKKQEQPKVEQAKYITIG